MEERGQIVWIKLVTEFNPNSPHDNNLPKNDKYI